MIYLNETLSAIAKRYSCRAFFETMPEPDKIEAIAKAAAQSPSGMNAQPWKIAVVRNRALIDELEGEAWRVIREMDDKSAYDRIMERGGKLFYGAPCVIVVAIKPDTDLDCGIVCENICIAAAGVGVNSLICGLAGLGFSDSKKDYFAEKLGFPQGYEFGMAVLLGFEREPGKPHEPDMGKVSFID